MLYPLNHTKKEPAGKQDKVGCTSAVDMGRGQKEGGKERTDTDQERGKAQGAQDRALRQCSTGGKAARSGAVCGRQRQGVTCHMLHVCVTVTCVCDMSHVTCEAGWEAVPRAMTSTAGVLFSLTGHAARLHLLLSGRQTCCLLSPMHLWRVFIRHTPRPH